MAKTNQKEALEAYRNGLAMSNIDVIQEISLCLSDIPREKMRKGSNGKIYANITVGMRKEPDQWGRDLKVFMTPTEEDKKNNALKVYVGGGKTFIFVSEAQQAPTDEEINNLLPESNDTKKDDLPFPI